ncbi:ABC transporter permease [Cytophagales bacterium LB-30]|uniref:ABC transporter permease n=1 Tax=Shiella aurantiaca TaxID=3058365 RepID=A0ABT8F2A1_9BACT|nr:ABC transporter permease [Shiella aurantiaca]MDN4164479.1 ABC transporter permease [Shiella aurantiaca]
MKKPASIPTWAERFFAWYCAPHLHEELQGDLAEQFEHHCSRYSVSKARRLYWWNVIRLLGPHTLKRKSVNYSTNNTIMFKNYLLVAYRSLMKRKSYTFINVFGLALGIASAYLIFAYVKHELSYDEFHSQKDHIYRSQVNFHIGGEDNNTSVSPTALLPHLKREFPEIKEGVRVYNPGIFAPMVLQVDEQKYEEKRFFYADSTFFKVFDYELIQGDKKTALSTPNSVLLTQRMATKYFGYTDPIGKTIRLNNVRDFTVTGILENVPQNSHLQFDFLATFSSLGVAKREEWWGANYQTFVVLNEQADVKVVEDRLFEQVKEMTKGQLPSNGDYVRYSFTPLLDLHFNTSYSNEWEPTSSMVYIYIFTAIAFLIILIACINYMNLSTARATDRAREVGMRKVMGAYRSQVFSQFMSEAILITLIAGMLALVLVQVAIPVFNDVTGKNFTSAILLNRELLSYFGAILLAVSLLAGAYPALALSGFKPIKVLKGQFKHSTSAVALRKGLVVFQFAISMFLIMSTLVIMSQLRFIQDKQLGYTKDQVLAFPLDYALSEKLPTIKQALSAQSGVLGVTSSTNLPNLVRGGYSLSVQGMAEGSELMITAQAIDENYLEVLDMELVAGEKLTATDALLVQDTVYQNRTYNILVNETAVRKLGLTPEEAVGIASNVGERKGIIKGVMKDFHYQSLQQEIGSVAYFIEPEQFNYVMVKVAPQNMEHTLAGLQTLWSKLAPHRPFEFEFLDENFKNMYASEQNIAQIFQVFSIIALLVGALGLFGLASYTTIQRAKEISVRKVLGASVGQLVILLNKDFVLLIVWAMVLAIPLSFYFMNQWLSNFAFRTEIHWFIPALAAILTLLAALLTVSWESVKSALSNPADRLKSE